MNSCRSLRTLRRHLLPPSLRYINHAFAGQLLLNLTRFFLPKIRSSFWHPRFYAENTIRACWTLLLKWMLLFLLHFKRALKLSALDLCLRCYTTKESSSPTSSVSWFTFCTAFFPLSGIYLLLAEPTSVCLVLTLHTDPSFKNILITVTFMKTLTHVCFHTWSGETRYLCECKLLQTGCSSSPVEEHWCFDPEVEVNTFLRVVDCWS
jgi:hypothetical protein